MPICRVFCLIIRFSSIFQMKLDRYRMIEAVHGEIQIDELKKRCCSLSVLILTEFRRCNDWKKIDAYPMKLQVFELYGNRVGAKVVLCCNMLINNSLSICLIFSRCLYEILFQCVKLGILIRIPTSFRNILKVNLICDLALSCCRPKTLNLEIHKGCFSNLVTERLKSTGYFIRFCVHEINRYETPNALASVYGCSGRSWGL